LSINGSAVDAVIAAGLCNGIANAQSTGIGGGHFMLIYLKEKRKIYAIDARETAPMSTNKWTFRNTSSLVGGLSTAIPGEIYGFWRAHILGGKLAWSTLFQPAIQMCRNGFKVSQVLAFSIKRAENHIRDSKELSNVFINPLTNETYKENDYIKMPKLAETLELISKTNINEFYNGKLAQTMVNEINENGLSNLFF
jgi:gamma-glutamyltranspeptidase/glutathione hydrolase/leukotriene-C4 hydrolase